MIQMKYKKGTKIQVPKTKSICGNIEGSHAIQYALGRKATFLHIEKIVSYREQECYLVEGDYFAEEDIVPYKIESWRDKIKC